MKTFAQPLALALVLVASAAHADRAAIREHQAARAVLREELRAASGPEQRVTTTLYHQVRDVAIDAQHKATLEATPGRGRAILRELLLPLGAHPGIWTSDAPEGWYADGRPKPFALELRHDAVLYDEDLPAHRAVHEAWRALDAKTRGPAAKNRFDDMKDATGRSSLAGRVAAIHAPREERFYKEMGIAGVAWWDTYGRKNIVILNPGEVTSVRATR